MSNNVISSRVQLKIDSEANWTTHSTFVPLAGELIIYSADATHAYARLKVGNGSDDVATLPFIDASTISGVNINNIVAKQVQHNLTFGAMGAYTYNGSEDVNVPVYDGTVI